MLLEAIALLVEQNALGTRGIDLFEGKLPASPDNAIAIFEYAGEPQMVNQPIEFPSLQLLVRNTSYQAGRAKIENIKNLLHGRHEELLSNVRYLFVSVKQNPYLLQRDENDRVIFVCNFSVIKELG